MKLSTAVLVTLASAEEKKVPPRHPLQRLAKLTEFSAEILDQWYDFLPSKESWKAKFATNAARMESNFKRGNQRCGFYDADLPNGGPAEVVIAEPAEAENAESADVRKRREADVAMDRYNREDPVEGTKQITTGFRKWAERYISQCSGQRLNQHQTKRMIKWNQKLQDHLANHPANQPE